jgi:hypothetical protein
VQSKVDAVKKALENNDMPAIQRTKDELSEHMQKIGEAMQSAGAQQQAGPGPSSAKSSMEEAEVEILDKEE